MNIYIFAFKFIIFNLYLEFKEQFYYNIYLKFYQILMQILNANDLSWI